MTFRQICRDVSVKTISFFDDPSRMAECKYISDREAKFLAAVLAALIIIPALWMARDVLTAPQTMIPVLIGVPLIAAIIWHEWGRTAQAPLPYALLLAGALALPVGALMYVFIGWIPVALGTKPIVVGAAFWTAAAIVILRQIANGLQKKGVRVVS